jgi:hypothetical protein
VKAAVGALIVVVHALGFAALAGRCRGTELTVDVAAPPASAVLALDGVVPGALRDRVTIDDSPGGPGLHRRRWRVGYRGGVERAVGAVQLVGPFQDPAAPACVGRVVVGQPLLDDGHAGPGTIAAAMRRQLEAELRGETIFPVGALVRIDRLALRWARLEVHPLDRALVGPAPNGYVRVTATLVFERVAVPVIVALIPVASPRELRFRIAARAQLAFDNRAAQWISDRLGGNQLATRLARRQLDDALVTAFAPPPPFQLSGGQTIRFTYCDEPIEIAEGASGALPFGVALGANPRDPRILPPRRGHGPRAAPAPASKLAIDLDLDALNALLYELWRGGFLDRGLATAGLDRRFNQDPTVAAFLSLRIGPPRLTLPPVVTASAAGLRLSAEATIAITDAGTVTTGRVWGGIDARFSPRAGDGTASPFRGAAGRGSPTGDGVAVDLGALELSCERTPTRLVPCYSDLVSALRGRAGELHGALTTTFATLLSEIFVGRLGAVGLPAELEIRGAAPTVQTALQNATLHLELDAAVAAR